MNCENGNPRLRCRAARLEDWKRATRYVPLLLSLVVSCTGEQPDQKDMSDVEIADGVAVLPFNVRGEEADSASYDLAMSVRDELLSAILRSGETRVMSRTGTDTLRDVRAAEVAVALGVKCVVQGTVDVHDGKTILTVQRIAANGDTVAAETFDRPGDVLDSADGANDILTSLRLGECSAAAE